ncbi:hypothetical protein D3880_04125 [Pseudomonas cavernae]|uniref:DUF1090 family protein n=1 Tax=Pseudomonas cavernae TaxID=2320867 RepID=A0A385Z081_9PSED|nr:hypothetical protein [Pseudomonas cavernae]AYC31627.1 hypothetical protein D3880_04125 [Pseudomonas cavernae]
MKRFAMLIVAALLTAPVFAADLCDINLQKLEDALATQAPNGDTATQQVEQLKAKAEEAKVVGDTEGCINNSNKALQVLENSDKGGGGIS